MWAALFRQVFAFVLTRRGKRVLALAGALFLCFIALLLGDLQYYWSASFVGLLALATTGMWLVQHIQVKRRDRERDRLLAARAARRAAAAQSRSERMDRAKSTVAGMARNVGSGAAGAAKASLAGMRSGFGLWRGKKP